MKRKDLVKGCQVKKPYSSEWEARRASDFRGIVFERGKYYRLRVYRCHFGNHFHLTKSGGEI